MKLVYSNLSWTTALIGLFLFCFVSAHSATITSQNSGNWDAGSTWLGGVVPAATDDVVIAANHVITVTGNATAATLSFTNSLSGSVLIVNESVTLTITGAVNINTTTASPLVTSTTTFQGAGTLAAGSFSIGSAAPNNNIYYTTLTSTIHSFVVSGTFALKSSKSGGRATTAIFNLSGGTLSIPQLTTTNAPAPNGTTAPAPTFTMAAGGSANATLILTGSTPFALGTGTICNLNGPGATVSYSGSNQPVYATAYTNLSINQSNGSAAVSAPLTIAGNLNLDNGTLACGSNIITVSGNISGSATATGAGGIVMNGGGKTISGVKLDKLTLDNLAGFSLTGSPTVVNSLSLNKGKLTLGQYNLTLGSSLVTGSVASSSASDYVVANGIGQLVFKIANGASLPVALTYPIGGTYYSPVSITLTAGTITNGQIGASVNGAKHPSNNSISNYLNRYWTVNQTGITGCLINLQATFVDPIDISGSVGNIVTGQLKGAFNTQSNPWIRFGALGVPNLTAFGASILDGQTSVFTGISGNVPSVSVSGGNVTVCNGTAVNLTANAGNGTEPYQYSWTPATGLSAPNIYNPIATPSSTTVYTITVYDANGAWASANTTITVNDVPLITIHPASQSIGQNDQVLFSVGVNAGANTDVTYQWWEVDASDNDLQLLSAAPTFTLDPVELADDGRRFRVKVTSCLITITSNTATLTVVAPKPPLSSTNLSIANIQSAQLDLSWTAGAGAARIIIASAGTPVSAMPVNGTQYTAGDILSAGNYVAYVGTGTSTTISGLVPSTLYNFMIYEFNGTGTQCSYRLDDPAAGTQSTRPSAASTGLSFDNISTAAMTLTWTSGNGTERLVIARQGSLPSAAPSDFIDYTSNSAYGSGSALGGGYVIYKGTGTSVTVTALSAATDYYYAVYEAAGSGAKKVYYPIVAPGVAPVLIGSQMTLSIPPTTQASDIIFTNVQSSQMNLTWTNGTGGNRIVVVREGSAVSGTPANASIYNANSTFGAGQTIAPDEFVIYNGSGTSALISGLTSGETYFFRVFEYTGTLVPNYLTTTSLRNPNNQSTRPTTPPSAMAFPADNLGAFEFKVTWEKNDAIHSLVIVSEENPIAGAAPVDGVVYSADVNYGAGSQLGNAYVAYIGTDEEVTVLSLQQNTVYYVQIFTFGGSQALATQTDYTVYNGTPVGGTVITTARFDYRSRNSGLWSDVNTWEYYKNGDWLEAQSPPKNQNQVFILQGHTVTQSSGSETSDQMEISGTLIIGSSATYTVKANTRIFYNLKIAETGSLQVFGTVIQGNRAKAWLDANPGNVRFYSGSNYQHDMKQAEGVIPLATWDNGSTVRITGYTQSFTATAEGNWSQSFSNVTFDCGACQTISYNGRLSNIGGNLTVNNTGLGQIVLNNSTTLATINVGGNLNVVSNSALSSATLVINGSSGTTNMSVAGNITVDGSVNAAPALATLSFGNGPNAGGAIVSISGNCSINTNGLITNGSTNSANFGQLDFNGGTHIFSNTGAMTGRVNLNVGAGTVLTIPTDNGFGGTGDFFLGANGEVQIASTAATGAFTASVDGTGTGAFYNSGLRTFSDPSTVRFYGTGVQLIGNDYPGSATNLHLVVDKDGGSLGSSNSFVVTGNLLLQQGEMIGPDGPGVLTLSGNFTRVNGSFTHNNSTILLNGAGVYSTQLLDMNQTFPISNVTLHTLRINKSGAGLIDITGYLPLVHLLQIESQTEVRNPEISPSIPSPTAFDKAQQLGFLYKGLTLMSTGTLTENDASIGPIPTGASVTGTVTVQRFMDNKGADNRYFSAPVKNAAVFQVQDDFAVTGRFTGTSLPCTGCDSRNLNSLRNYIEAVKGPYSQGYSRYPISLNSEKFEVGRGYLAFMFNPATNPGTFDMAGPINSGDITKTLSYTSTPLLGEDGWHLLGNPYPSAIYWGPTGFIRSPEVDATIAVTDVDFAQDGHPIYYRYWNYNDNTGSPDPQYDPGYGYAPLPGGIIAMGQAFWVYVSGPASLTFQESAKTSSGAGKQFRTEVSSASEQLIIDVGNDKYHDHAFLKFNPESSERFDRFDGHKFKNEFLSVYLKDQSGTDLVMHTLPKFADGRLIPLGIELSAPGVYSIGFSNYEKFRFASSLYLIDMEAQTAVPVGAGTRYFFTIDTPRIIEGRFFLSMGDQGFNSEVSVLLYPNPASSSISLKVSGSTGEIPGRLLDLNGKSLLAKKFKNDEVIDLSDFAPGVYLLKLSIQGKVVIKKIVKY